MNETIQERRAEQAFDPADPNSYTRCPKCAMYLEAGMKGPRCPVCGELADMLAPMPMEERFPVTLKAVGQAEMPADLKFALQEADAIQEQLADKIAAKMQPPPQTAPACPVDAVPSPGEVSPPPPAPPATAKKGK